MSPAERNETVTVTIGSVPISGIVVRAQPDSFAVHLLHTEATRAHLIRHVFSGGYQNAVDRVHVGNVALGVMSRLWR